MVAEIVDQLHAGAHVEIDAYIARCPERAEELRRLLPALEVLHGLRSSAIGVSGVGRNANGAMLSGELGDYRLLREVGRGGMGVVYEAEQISLGRHVALKVLPFASAMDPRHLQRFRNEAQAAAQLHHTNIVPVYGVGSERGVHYYAMQFIDGLPLSAWIAEQRKVSTLSTSQQPTDEYQLNSGSAPTSVTAAIAGATTARVTPETSCFRRIAEWGIQAASALEHAHELGVVHRDIKPANLLVDARGNLWITDFGLAHCQSHPGLTMTGDLVGTLRYMSPEQALAKHVVLDHRTDVYSLGATLYELLTLEPVFAGSDRQELLRQIAFDEPRPPRRVNKAIPAELETIVLKALEKSPADRYATAQEIADDLRRFLDDKPIRAKRATALQMLKKWARRNRNMVRTVVGSAFLVLAALACLLVWRLHEGEKLAEERQRMAEDQTARLQQDLDRLSEANNCIQRGRFFVEGGQWARADQAFTQAVTLRPDNSFVWYERGEFYTRLGLWDRAAADYAEAYRIQQPPTTRHRWAHAVLRAYVGDLQGYQQACTAIQRLSDETSLGRENELARACTLVPAAGMNLAWARRMAEQAVQRDSRAPWNHYVLGMAHYRLEDYEKAVQRFEESLAVDPDFLEGCLNKCALAMAYQRLGRHEEAVRTLAVAAAVMEDWTRSMLAWERFAPPILWLEWLEILLLHREARIVVDGAPPPEDGRLLCARGLALAAVNCPEQAATCYSRAEQLGPDDLPIRLAVLRATSMQQYQKAIADLGGNLELHWTTFNRLPSHYQADAYAAQGQWDKAVFEYALMVKMNPRDPDHWCLYAGALLLKGDAEGYRRVCKDVLQRYQIRQNPLARYMVSRILSLAPHDVREPAQALQWAQQAATADPTPWKLHTLAVAHYRAGQFEQTVEHCQTSLRIGDNWGGDVLNWLLLAMAHERLGNADEARHWLDKAVKWIDLATEGKPKEARYYLPLPSACDRQEVQLLLREAESLIGTKNGR
jgi:serine/threonine protein kinase/Flp pilus assembly protein TadD